MKKLITKEEVAKAVADLVAQGKKPTLVAVHAALGNRGSMSTVVRLRTEILADTQPAKDSPEALKAFREVWALAFEEGRKQQGTVIAELGETVNALAAENERLEGSALAARNQLAELESSKMRAEKELNEVRTQMGGELSRVKTSLADANAQAAGALQKLAAAQATHAETVAALQTELKATVRKAHDLELQLARAGVLAETKGAQSTPAESTKLRRPKVT